MSSWQTLWPSDTITLPMPLSYPNITIAWGDFTVPTYHSGGSINHTYANANYYQITITGAVFGFGFSNGGGGDRLKIREIASWGEFTMDSNSTYAFYGCENLRVLASDQPTFLPGTRLNYMFAGTKQISSTFNWNITNVVSLTGMFEDSVQNQAISFSGSDGVTRTDYMFSNAIAYNSPILWDTSAVMTMAYMFAGATNFQQDLEMDTRRVEDMTRMFFGATSLRNILKFNTSRVKSMAYMFDGASSYDREPQFDTSSCLDMSGMFRNTRTFNQDLHFDTQNVKNMSEMFRAADSMNGNLYFNTSNVVDFSFFMSNARAYQKTLSFDTRAAVSMDSMFRGAHSFTSFNFTSTTKVRNMHAFLMSTRAFNKPLTPQILQTDNVTDMSSFLEESLIFNSEISLVTSNVQTMSRFLFQASSFNQPLTLNTTEVTNFSFMFGEAALMNSIVSFTPTSNATSMRGMFQSATNFNSHIQFGNTLSLLDIGYMFYNASSYNVLGLNLNTTLVSDMSFSFAYASSFNQRLFFDTKNVVNASYMFLNATSYYPDSLAFDTSKVVDMTQMFFGVSNSFDLDLSSWDTTNTLYCAQFCHHCGMPSFPSCTPCTLLITRYNASVCNCPATTIRNGSVCTGSRTPTVSPTTKVPTAPTLAPSFTPTPPPSLAPIPLPSPAPTPLPSFPQTAAPSPLPSSYPSQFLPVLTSSPSVSPTPLPSAQPTTTFPTSLPTPANFPTTSPTRDLCTVALIGPGLQSNCVTSPPTPVIIPPNPKFVIVSPVLNITINSSELAGSTFMFTLPINPAIRQGIVNQNCYGSQISCAWQQPETGEFLESGCDLTAENVNMGSGVVGSQCTCTHLTVFALVLRSELRGNALCQAETSDYVLLGLYGILTVVVLVQICRLAHARVFGRTFAMHALLFISPLLRIIYLVAKPVINSVAGLVFLGLVPSSLALSLFIHLLLAWASIQMFSMKTSPFSKFRIPFIVTIVCVFLLTFAIVVAVAVAPDPTTEKNVVIYGSYVLAVFFAIVCILVLLSGLGLNQMLKKNAAGVSSKNSRWRVLARYRVLFSTLGLSLCLFFEAALWIAAVQEDILVSSSATLATSTAFYVCDWISLCVLTALFPADVGAAKRFCLLVFICCS